MSIALLVLVELLAALLVLAGGWGFVVMFLAVPVALDSKPRGWRFLFNTALVLTSASAGLTAVLLAQRPLWADNLIDALNLVALPALWLFIGLFASLALWKYSKQPAKFE
ncbi:MAG: hypothetical protein A4S17_05255 [Proteobacteria bacterium HN_bin10]|jgi:hypothetical protein|nr:MAG: hypothetical protein A4S17_05255 [Proteobacteria bacterium HN_bin10]